MSNFTGLESLDSIGGILDIDGNDELVDLSGLNNLCSIGGFWLFGNNELTDMTSLSSLITINGSLQISWNRSLINLSGLNAVTSVGGDIVIYYNRELTSLNGLENIAAETIGNLSVHNNMSLSNCDVLSICNYLANPNGSVNIFSNAPGCNNPVEIADGCGITLDCLPFGNYYFSSQAELDSFQDDYPECYDLHGNMKISGEDITSLSGLSEITSVEGNFSVYRNDSLIDFTGLSSLGTIGNNFSIGWYEGKGNPSLINFNGLEGLNNVGGRIGIYFNDALMNLSGLGSLTSIGGLDIVANYSLVSLSGIENLDSISEDLSISSNIYLLNLMGLENLTYVGSILMIQNNDSLKSLSGLDNIEVDSIYYIDINGNASLSICEVNSVCNYLVFTDAWVSIHDNAPGCNSQQEVEEACAVSVNEIKLSENVSIYPNPFTTSTTIEYELKKSAEVTINIYNCFGEQIELIRENQLAGKQEVVWNAKNLPSGMYYFTLEVGERMTSGKMLVVN